MSKKGGYQQIHDDLMETLAGTDFKDPVRFLGLDCQDDGRAVVPCMGKKYLVGREGVAMEGGGIPSINLGSVLAGYILTGGSGEPAGRFVPMDALTEMVSTTISYVGKGLESRLTKYAERDPEKFNRAVGVLGGAPGGDVGSGGKSWIIELLPKMPAQLIFYMGDDEFPSETRLFFDITAVHFLEFEFLAVLATIFVQELIETFRREPD